MSPLRDSLASSSSLTSAPSSSSAAASANPSLPATRRRRKQRYSRSRTGCLTCRQRKVKCDESRPVCAKCLDLEKDCVWPSTTFVTFKPSGQQVEHGDSPLHSCASLPSGGWQLSAGSNSGTISNSQSRSHASPTSGSCSISGAAKAGVHSHSHAPQHAPSQSHSHTHTDALCSTGAATGTRWSLPAASQVPVSLYHTAPNLLEQCLDTYGAEQCIATIVDVLRGNSVLSGTSGITTFDADMGDVDCLDSATLLGRREVTLQGQEGTSVGLNSAATVNADSPTMGPRTISKEATRTILGFDSTVVSAPDSSLALRRKVAFPGLTGPDTTARNLSFVEIVEPKVPFQLLRTPTTQPADPIADAFPSAAGRRLFDHVFNMTSSIVIAMGKWSNHSPKARSKNPFLAVSLPLILHSSESPARAAFRLGVLSLGACHLHHQYLESSAEQAAAMLEETCAAKRQACAQLILGLSKEGDRHIDMMLATCMTIKTRDILMADKTWKQNIDFALRLVFKRGGPAQLLAEEPHNYPRRHVIEQLATTDVFSTFTTGDEPILLGAPAPWWFEHAKSAKSDWQWEAYERQFGMSRAMCELVARCRVCVYRKYRLCGVVKTGEVESSEIAATVDRDAWALVDELRVWSVEQLSVPQRSRVCLGDSAYRYAMIIMLLTEVLGEESSHQQIRAAVHCVLELCSDISQEPVMLVWPLLIAGANATGSDRQWAKDLLHIFQGDYCSDLVIASKLLTEQWTRIDDGRGFTPWDRLIKEMDCAVLLI